MVSGSRPKRVLHLIKGLGRGGAEMLLPELLRVSDRERFDFSYGYFLPWKNALVGDLEEQGAPVTCFERRTSAGILFSVRALARFLERESVDLLHCHMPLAGVAGRIAAHRLGIPVVYSEHNLQERFHPVTRTLNRVTWRWQRHVVAVSSDVASSIEKSIGFDIPVRVVLNGVNVDQYQRDPASAAEVRARYSIPPGSPVIGTVAVFRTQKRLLDWIAAADLIRRNHPSASFLLVGDGPLRNEVHEAIVSHHLSGVVHLPGLQDDVRPYLSAMDIYMMSSQFEGLPVALLEAMAAECTPVCTAVGGIPEVITHGESGWLTEPGKPEGLAAAVSMLLGDRSRLGAIGRRARDVVSERFSISRMAAEIEALYEQVLTLPPARVPGRPS